MRYFTSPSLTHLLCTDYKFGRERCWIRLLPIIMLQCLRYRPIRIKKFSIMWNHKFIGATTLHCIPGGGRGGPQLLSWRSLSFWFPRLSISVVVSGETVQNSRTHYCCIACYSIDCDKIDSRIPKTLQYTDKSDVFNTFKLWNICYLNCMVTWSFTKLTAIENVDIF